MQRHEIVREIIIRPNFRPATAVLNCDKESLRWPGPFSTGFLSPQPPGAVGIGPVRRIVYPILGQRELVLFLFWGGRHSPTRQLARLRARVGANPQPRPINFLDSGLTRRRVSPDVPLRIGEWRGCLHRAMRQAEIRRKFLFRESARITVHLKRTTTEGHANAGTR